MAESPQKQDFLTWCIQSFVRKVKQFVGNIYASLIDLANKVCNRKTLILFCSMSY